jgi:spore maturation protein SpmA
MLNLIFFAIMLFSILLAAFTGRMEAVTQATLKTAREAVDLALGLVGVMAFFLGLMKVAEEGGLLFLLAKLLRPVLRKVFPEVPPDHPAIGAIIMNMAANFLGLGNAATPFGIKAMMELDRLNGTKGTATNAMVLFLAINTSGLTLLPTTMLSLRASAQSQNAAGVLFPIWIAGICATLMALLIAPGLARISSFQRSNPPGTSGTFSEQSSPADSVQINNPGHGPVPRWRLLMAAMVLLAFGSAVVLFIVRSRQAMNWLELFRNLVSFWILPALLLSIFLFGWIREVKIYDALIEGAKEGFNVALKIIPYLVAILVMVGVLRAAGGFELLVNIISPATNWIGLPAEALPVALLRPFSGSGTLGFIADLFKTCGPDSLIGYMASTIYGSTETTFYVLAVYFGAVGIKRTRHAIPACLLADLSGILAGILVVKWIY